MVAHDLDDHAYTDFNTLGHIARYKWVLPYLGGLCLDDGCGSGYGTHYLAKHGVRILGIDKSKKAIKYAKRHYQHPLLEFKEMNSLHTDLGGYYFDSVLTFDVFEHLDEKQQHDFLREIHRVLKKGGTLCIGTPNKDANPWTGSNPHHKRELTLNEFKALLQEFFTDVSYYAQHIVINGKRHNWYTFVLERTPLGQESFVVLNDFHNEGFGFLAVCKNT